MKRDDAAVVREPRQQRRIVAVADEGFGCAADLVAIEIRQELDAAVASAHGDERTHRRIAPGADERVRPQRRLTGGIPRPREDAFVVDRLIPEAAQFGHTGVELVTRKWAGRSDDRDAIPLTQGRRLQH